MGAEGRSATYVGNPLMVLSNACGLLTERHCKIYVAEPRLSGHLHHFHQGVTPDFELSVRSYDRIVGCLHRRFPVCSIQPYCHGISLLSTTCISPLTPRAKEILAKIGLCLIEMN